MSCFPESFHWVIFRAAVLHLLLTEKYTVIYSKDLKELHDLCINVETFEF